LVGVAKLLPASDHTAADILIFVAPLVTAFSRSVWVFAAAEAERRWNLRRRGMELNQLLADQKIARAQRDQTLADPLASDAQKADAQKTCRSIDDAIQEILRRPEE